MAAHSYHAISVFGLGGVLYLNSPYIADHSCIANLVSARNSSKGFQLQRTLSSQLCSGGNFSKILRLKPTPTKQIFVRALNSSKVPFRNFLCQSTQLFIQRIRLQSYIASSNVFIQNKLVPALR